MHEADGGDLEVEWTDDCATNFQSVAQGRVRGRRVVVKWQGLKRGKRLDDDCDSAIPVTILLRAVQQFAPDYGASEDFSRL